MTAKIVRFTRNRETAADVHWNEIDDAARNLVHLATMINAALQGGNGGDVAKTLCAELIRNGAGIVNLQRDLLHYGWNRTYDDGIETLARVSTNLLAAPQWATAMHPSLTDELRRLAGVIQSAAQARRLARQEVAQAQQRQATN